ncbi:MAG: hypothetical protein WAO56_06225 [Miniphocaeibacter sp.]|uniref:hypothetical protein n=1 Tax=Miniphocaeibacter sp. TaxID=3100973 RepID=UPI0017E408FB|nr:hypothetical protein [Gallicola sp.]
MKMILLTILPILSIIFLTFILYNFKKYLFVKPLADDLTSNKKYIPIKYRIRKVIPF